MRVLESLPAVLRGEDRVSVVFAYDSTSAFNDGVLELLRDAGCRVMPWDQLEHITVDLVVTASENIEVPEGDCPVLVLPHGVGFHKQVPDSRGTGARLSGVVSDTLLKTGRVWQAVSHPAQEAELLSVQPEAAGRTVLVGDPCLDELEGSRPRRQAYRAALGVAESQRLVVISSTWGRTSLLGQHPVLPARVLAQLPWDEYRVAAVVHPNVWAAHGAWQLRAVLADCVDAGLMVMPPVHAWRAALVAADVLIGDHGSVTLYGASAGVPVLMGAFGLDAMTGSAVGDLAACAPRLDVDGDLRGQIEDAMRTHTPYQYAQIADKAFAERGQALARLRHVIYRLLKLSEPPAAAPSAATVPLAQRPGSEVTSWLVTTHVTAGGAEPVIGVSRFPAAVGTVAKEVESAVSFTHLACTDEEADSRLAESASVLLCSRSASSAVAAVRWIEDELERLPGSLMAATRVRGGGVLVGLRDGRVVEAMVTGPVRDTGLCAAVVYACLRSGLTVDDAMLTLRVGDGGQEEAVALRVRPGLPVV
ncbi:hypothetical protein [Streptomyces sp. NBC_01613]|uniref:hypothetical protein n=1 Tax=Streptomyces sp. NBC_01613 TaxID=2975896 RepID=UPI00386B6C2F